MGPRGSTARVVVNGAQFASRTTMQSRLATSASGRAHQTLCAAGSPRQPPPPPTPLPTRSLLILPHPIPSLTRRHTTSSVVCRARRVKGSWCQNQSATAPYGAAAVVPPGRLERPHPAPEAGALSAEL